MISALIQSNYAQSDANVAMEANSAQVDPLNVNYFYAGYLNQLFEIIPDPLNDCLYDTRLTFIIDEAMQYQAAGQFDRAKSQWQLTQPLLKIDS